MPWTKVKTPRSLDDLSKGDFVRLRGKNFKVYATYLGLELDAKRTKAMFSVERRDCTIQINYPSYKLRFGKKGITFLGLAL